MGTARRDPHAGQGTASLRCLPDCRELIVLSPRHPRISCLVGREHPGHAWEGTEQGLGHVQDAENESSDVPKRQSMFPKTVSRLTGSGRVPSRRLGFGLETSAGGTVLIVFVAGTISLAGGLQAAVEDLGREARPL